MRHIHSESRLGRAVDGRATPSRSTHPPFYESEILAARCEYHL